MTAKLGILLTCILVLANSPAQAFGLSKSWEKQIPAELSAVRSQETAVFGPKNAIPVPPLIVFLSETLTRGDTLLVLRLRLKTPGIYRKNVLECTGQEKESDLGLYYYGARFYDPDTGRFLQVDPKRELWAGYGYVANNPVRAIDPNGKEIQILVGGPYGNMPYGHVAIRVYGKGYDFIFDFGRYGKTWGIGGSEGEGQLRIWENAFKEYIFTENSTGRTTTGFTFETTLEQDQAVISHFEKATEGIDANLVRHFKSGGEMRQGRLPTDYGALTCNCTTVSTGGFNAAFPSVSFENTDFNEGRGLGWKEKAAAKIKGWPKFIFMPLDLKAYIESFDGEKAIKPVKVEQFSNEKK